MNKIREAFSNTLMFFAFVGVFFVVIIGFMVNIGLLLTVFEAFGFFAALGVLFLEVFLFSVFRK